MTARFRANGVSGFGGCNQYGVRLEPEVRLVRGDGSFATINEVESTVMDCHDPPGVMEQENRYTRLLQKFEGFRKYGDLLIVQTKDDGFLLFEVW